MTLLTNKHNLPQPFVEAVISDDAQYVPGPNEIRVTELLSPPQIVELKRKHRDELTDDAADLIWLALGKAFHLLMEQSEKRWHVLSEKRLFLEREGWRVTGMFDNFDVLTGDEGGTITDWKLTTAYRVLTGSGIHEWTPQLNIYAHMLREKGYSVTNLQVGAALRDWHKTDAARDPKYPQSQVAIIPIELWSPAKCEDYLLDRLRLHQEARKTGILPACTDEERWMRKPKFALVREGQTRAVKVFSSPEEAQAWGLEKRMFDGQEWKRGLELQYRAAAPMRCQHYCPVSNFCKQWKDDPLNVRKEIQDFFNK